MEGLSPSERRAYARFRDAVIDFSDDPSPEHLARYLAASRALGESRRGVRRRSAPVPPSPGRTAGTAAG